MEWLVKKNSLLKKEVEKLTQRISVLDGTIASQDERIQQLKTNFNTESSQRQKIDTELNELKKEAVSFYKNELLINSMKIIVKILKEEKPTDFLVRQQSLAYDKWNNLSRLQQASSRSYLYEQGGSVLNGLGL